VHVERWRWHSSSSQKSRPGRISTSVSVRRATSTASIDAMPSIARSTVFLSGTFLPPRRPSFAVTTTLHRASMMRSRSESAENPPKTTECTAPMRAHASIV
jgi:hypothetical protein